jgi:hypothetical protein
MMVPHSQIGDAVSPFQKEVMFRNELVLYERRVVNGSRIDDNPVNYAGLDFSGFGNFIMELSAWIPMLVASLEPEA